MAMLLTDRKSAAELHVARGREIVERQRRLINEIRARKGDCELAELLLQGFESSLSIFEDDLGGHRTQERLSLGTSAAVRSLCTVSDRSYS